MASKSQDTVIDDDEETCPLCIEEFDLSDRNFRPCPCGYQICQFCFNSLKTTYEKSTCPNCRRPYDERTIQYKIPTAEEFKLDQLNKNKKQAAAKRKETEKREVEASSRRNLAGVRVKQQNLVYVIGLIPSIKDESALLQTLRGPEYFGRYGDIEKIVVSKPKPGAVNQGIGVYVTYVRKEDAALCINTVDGSQNGDRILRAQFGTTKYCSAYLRGEVCNNKNCSFLHETGEDGHNMSLQNEPSYAPRSNPRSTPIPQAIQLPPRAQSTPHPPAPSSVKDDTASRKESADGSALPLTASWANVNAPVVRARRASQAARSTPSPSITHASLNVQKNEESKTKESTPVLQPTIPNVERSVTTTTDEKQGAEELVTQKKEFAKNEKVEIFDRVIKSATNPNLRFSFDCSWMSSEAQEQMDHVPRFIDPYGGAKRRLMRDRQEAEEAEVEAETRARLEAQMKATGEDILEDEGIIAGSLALGGEPEENPRSNSTRGAIQRPFQSGTASSFATEAFSGTGGASLTLQQRQKLGATSSATIPTAPGLQAPPHNTAFEISDFDRRGQHISQAQYDQISNHQRHGSRYFNSDSKNGPSRFQGQQQTFYSSGVHGPPPGLPTAGTPPVSGGGMFSHGQNFTNPGFGNAKDQGGDNFTRGRSGTNAGHDIAKRGGVEQLADPSIVQARIQGNTGGQGLFGGNQANRDEVDFPPLPSQSVLQTPALHSRGSSFQSAAGSGVRTITPKVPPGFESTHPHPVTLPNGPARTQIPLSKTQQSVPVSVIPAVPLLPIGSKLPTPKTKVNTMNEHGKKTKEKGLTEAELFEVQGENSVMNPDTISLDSLKSMAAPVKMISSPASLCTLVESNSSLPDSGKSIVEHVGVPQEPHAGNSVVENSSDKTPKKLQEKPSKIEIPIAASTKHPVPAGYHSSSMDPVFDSEVVATPPPLHSQPGTPATTTSEISRVSVPRARTLRLTTTSNNSKLEHTPTPAAMDASNFQNFVAKHASRQPSISSVPRSRPSTPAMSERIFSNDVSRAGSPPPSIIGSAPERAKSKSQVKKERKEKLKKIGDQSDAGSIAPSTPVIEEVAPVIARQKKQKKKSGTTKNNIERTKIVSGNVTEESSSVADSTEKLDTKDSELAEKPHLSNKGQSRYLKSETEVTDSVVDPEEEDELAEESESEPYTIRDLYSDAARLPPDMAKPIQKLLDEHIAPMSRIISSMVESGDLCKDHTWLAPASFNSVAYKLPADHRRGQNYLDGNGYTDTDAFGYIYLPQKDKRALYGGNIVSNADNMDRKNDLLRRWLITPSGTVLRHLTVAEGEKVLELEERRHLYAEDFGEIGMMPGLGALEPDDFINLGGGMEELARLGDDHGVCWIMTGDQAPLRRTAGTASDDYLDELHGLEDEQALSDVTDDLGVDDGSPTVNMPGAWDTSRSRGPIASGQRPRSQHTSTGGNAPRSMQNSTGHRGNISLRAMDAEALQKRVAETGKELEAARKEMEKIEKMFTKKSKEAAKFRELLIRG